MRHSDISRQDLRRTLYSFMVALVVALIGLTVLLATIYRQARAQQRYAKMLELAVHNLRATIESSRDAVLIVSAAGDVIASNTAGEDMLGRAVSVSAPMPLAEVLCLPEGCLPPSVQGELMECRGRNGKRIPVEVSIAATSTATGQALRIAFLRDMTLQLERERKLAEASAMARKGEEAKDRFLAVMSHEMRTPLSGLLSATDLMETTTPLDSQQKWLMDIVKSCGLAALEQVNNILELTRLSAHDSNDYPSSDFCLAEVIRQQAQLYQALALDRGNRLQITTDEASTCQIRAPLPLLRRILNNLLSNAIKFTRDGVIEVTLATLSPRQAKTGRFRLSIRDTGIGIAETDLERIFHNFETLDSSYSRTQEGTGLGLGIAKLAAEAMGGTTAVESVLGKGTCFTVTFAAEVLEQMPAPAQTGAFAPDRPVALRILLAEDNEINRLLMERQLNGLGHTVTLACDGAEAIAAVEGGQFDIILMDISMPRVDGLSATRQLRDSGALATTPVIALTAQAAPNRIQMLREAGMAEVVTKPVPVAQLDQVMQRLVARPEPGPVHGQGPLPQALLDQAQLAELIEDMGCDLLQQMLDRFDQEMRVTRRALADALSAGALADVCRIAHKAAGAAAVLTLSALAEALRAIEAGAEAGQVEDMTARCASLDPLTAQSVQALHLQLKEG